VRKGSSFDFQICILNASMAAMSCAAVLLASTSTENKRAKAAYRSQCFDAIKNAYDKLKCIVTK
jgi:hypothetical protein